VQQFSSEMPHDENNLRSLPGVGEYTARALLCFAFHKQVTVIDTNVRKVIIHELLYGKEESKKRIEQIAQQILPKGKAYEWNQALMDYSSATLKKEKIPVVKQTRFKGSNRYYRGQIIKLLLEKKEVKGEALTELFHKDEAFISRVVQGLEKDGMVKRKGRLITLH
jgi:A/G-specific adenine glycosylase